MCNACGFYCCALDTFDQCGCDTCPNLDCHDPETSDLFWEPGEDEDREDPDDLLFGPETH